jgi:UDP-glucose 4-epimerase
MITGGAGFVGSHLSESFLKEGNDIIIASRSSSKFENLKNIHDKIIIENVDVTNFPEINCVIKNHNPDVIIHLAGETSHSKSFDNPLYDVDVNSKSTLNILEQIRQLKLKTRFVLGSTFIVIGKPEKLPINEETSCNPTTIYGVNRLASEFFCKIYHDLYDVDTVIFRITNSFGPREQIIPNKNAINYLIYKAFKGENITIYNNGNFFRDLIFINDVVSGIKTITKNGVPGNLYWISSGEKTWFYQLGQWLEEFTSAKIEYVEAPTYTKKVDVGNFLVDNSKLKSLGWIPNIHVKDGIKQTLDYFKSVMHQN